jgi:hypothetical protein
MVPTTLDALTNLKRQDSAIRGFLSIALDSVECPAWAVSRNIFERIVYQ